MARFRDRRVAFADALMPLFLSRCFFFCSFVTILPPPAELVGLSIPENIAAAMAADVSLLSGSSIALIVRKKSCEKYRHSRGPTLFMVVCFTARIVDIIFSFMKRVLLVAVIVGHDGVGCRTLPCFREERDVSLCRNSSRGEHRTRSCQAVRHDYLAMHNAELYDMYRAVDTHIRPIRPVAASFSGRPPKSPSSFRVCGHRIFCLNLTDLFFKFMVPRYCSFTAVSRSPKTETPRTHYSIP